MCPQLAGTLGEELAARVVAEATGNTTQPTAPAPAAGDGDRADAPPAPASTAPLTPDAHAASWDASRLSDDTLKAVLAAVWGHSDFRGSQLGLVGGAWPLGSDAQCTCV